MNEPENLSQLSDMRASMGMVLTGPCRELASILNKIERDLPDGVRVVYKRFSPGHIYIVVDGLECGRRC